MASLATDHPDSPGKAHFAEDTTSPVVDEEQKEPKSPHPTDSKGWDGKLRVGKQAVLVNPEALEDSEYSDEDAPPVAIIAEDEGESLFLDCVM
jgi:hypothetical protein